MRRIRACLTSFARTSRQRSVASLVALAILGLAPAAQSAPVSVTYDLSGGTTSGPFGVGDVVSGSATVVFPNPLSLDQATLTALTLTGTAGTIVWPGGWFGYPLANTGALALTPSGSIDGNMTNYAGYGTCNPRGGAINFAGTPGGAIVNGGVATYGSGSCPSYGYLQLSWQNVTAQEIPEPTRPLMLVAGCVLLAALHKVRTSTRASARS